MNDPIERARKRMDNLLWSRDKEAFQRYFDDVKDEREEVLKDYERGRWLNEDPS